MSYTTNFPFTTPSNYTYDNTKIEVTGGVAKLKNQVGDVDFTEDFADDTGFTYDAAKAEFTGGLVRQKLTAIIENYLQSFASDSGFTYDAAKSEFASGLARQKSQRPANATCGATYTNDVNLNWGNGTLTGTAIGGASVSGGKLDLTGGTIKGVSYVGTSNADSYQKGCIRFKFTPNWTGISYGTQSIFNIGRAGDINGLSIRTISGSTDLKLRVTDQNGNYIINADFGGFSAVDGQEYKFQLNYDFTLGQTRLYVDGTNIGGLHAGTGTRSGVCDKFYIGTDFSETQLSRFKIDDFEVFSDIQTVESSYSVPEKDYLETIVTCPSVPYTYNISSFGAPTITSVNAPKYVVNGYAYFGGSWQASSNTYATAMTSADWVTNVATFPGGQLGTGVIVKVIFQDSNTLGSVDSIAFDINENHYVVNNVVLPEMEHAGEGTIFLFNSFAVTESNAPRYTLQIERSGNYLYWNGSAWVVSDGSFAQANTASVFNTNCGSLDVNGKNYGQFKLHFNESNVQQSCSELTANMNVNTGYLTTNPSIMDNTSLRSSELISFSEIVTKAGSDNVKYIIQVNGIDKWSNAGTVEASNGTYSQANTAAEINAVIGDFLSTRALFKIKAFIHSDTGATTPELDSLSIIYNLAIDLVEPTLVEIEGFFYDTNGPISGEKIYVRPYQHGFWNGSVFHKYAWEEIGTTDANGYLVANIYKQPSSEYWEMKVGAQKYYFELSDALEQDLSSLSTWGVVSDE